MLDLLTPAMQRHLLLLADYIQALEQGDLETTGQILAAAEHDEILARMILEANSLQDDMQMELRPEEQSLIDSLLANDLPFPQETARPGQPLLAWSRSTQNRRSRSGDAKDRSKRLRTFFGGLAAVLLVSVLVSSFLLVLTQTHQASTKTAGSQNNPSWQTVALPIIINGGRLEAFSALSANEAWAVEEKVALHWNGQKWASVPGLPVSNFTLASVVALTAQDVWVGGSYQDSNAPGKGTKPLLAHWDGQQWSVAASNSFPTLGEITALTGLSTNDVWATGDTINAQTESQPAIFHWNGQQWSNVPHPERPGTSNASLNAIAALSANDVWTVGSDSYNHPGQYQANVNETLIEHWDGTAWKIVPSPSAGINDYLTAISAISANNIWTVGGTDQGTSNASANAGASLKPEAQIEHWDGTHWTMVQPAQSSSVLSGIAALSANNIWAVGALSDAHGNVISQLEHWDGKTWSSKKLDGYPSAVLTRITAIPGTNEIWLAWANSQNLLIGNS